jgi:hypothetical protein
MLPEFIGDLGYTGETYSKLRRMAEDIAKNGGLEKFLEFRTEVEFAISNRDSFNEKEMEVISDILEKSNYFEDERNGNYLESLVELIEYTEREIEGEDEFKEEALMYAFREFLSELKEYDQESHKKENLERVRKMEEEEIYDFLTKQNILEYLK